MAYTPGYSGLLNAAFPRIGQYEASTGRRINKQVVQGLIQADLDKAKAFSMQENFRNRQLQQQQDQFNAQLDYQKQGATMGGVGQLLQLPMAYQSAKGTGLLGGANAAPAATTAQGAVAPVAAVGTTAQGSAAYTGATGTAAYGSAEGAGAASTLGAEGVGAGLLGTAGAVALPAAGGAGLGILGMSKLTGAGKPGHQGGEVTTSNVAGGIIGGAIAGAAATSWSGPGAIVGGVIGGAIGLVSSLF